MIDYDSLGLFSISENLLRDICGGDVTVLAPLLGDGFNPDHPQARNISCPSYTVPGSIDAQLNVTCGGVAWTTAPLGANLACPPNQSGTNLVCYVNLGC